MGKITAQRKFAQGVYVPPSTQVANTDRKPVDFAKDPKNIIRRKTTAKTLLDMVSLESTHKHQPVVVLERLNIDTVENPVVHSDNSLFVEIGSTPNTPIKSRVQDEVPLKSPLMTRAMKLRSGVKKMKEKCACLVKSSHQGHLKERRRPTRKAALKASLCLNSVDTEFSVDDDKPLATFTRSSKKNRPKQKSLICGSKNKKKGLKTKSSPAGSLRSSTAKNERTSSKGEEEHKSTQTDDSEDSSPDLPANKTSNGYSAPIGPPIDQLQFPTTSNGCGDSAWKGHSNSLLLNSEEDLGIEEWPVKEDCDSPRGWRWSTSDDELQPEQSCKRQSRYDAHKLANDRAQSSPSATQPRIKGKAKDKTKGGEPKPDYAEAGPSGLQSRLRLQTEIDRAQSSPSAAQPRTKGNAKDKSKGRDPKPDYAEAGPSGLQSRLRLQTEIDYAEAGPSGLQSRLRLQTEIDLTQEDSRPPSPNNSDSSLDGDGLPSHEAYIQNKRVQNWVDLTVFKVPKVPKARTRQNSPYANNERYSQRGTRRSSSTPAAVRAWPADAPDAPDAPDTPSRKRPRMETAQLVDAPCFHPTAEEFTDPVAYFEKIMPEASKYGLCKVVPPAGFNPGCKLNDTMRFHVTNQYIERMYTRWCDVTREMCAMRAHLATLKIACTQHPLLNGLEVDLPKLYHAVNNNGGLKNINKKTWAKVAEESNCGKMSHPDRRLDQLYMKYVVPYDSLSKRERQNMINTVDRLWQKRYKLMLERAMNPLPQYHLLGESESSDEDEASSYEEDIKRFPHLYKLLKEAEECIIKGRHMNLNTYKRIAGNSFKTYFSNGASLEKKENFYWQCVLHGKNHVCVNSASIETSSEGFGFTNNKQEPYGTHAWNLKMLNQNSGNILRLLGPVVGLTVPTLHLGMLFSTSCWHRDPHALPWMEFMHEGTRKIWYGIPDEESEKFRTAVEVLSPTSCQNKSIWLSSDVTMIPPGLLLERSVSMSRVLQNPGEFVIVFPKAYSSSICTGYTVSESVYFATNHYMNNISQVFQELRMSCEPSMFSLEQLLISAASDPDSTLERLQLVHASLTHIVEAELNHRAGLLKLGLTPRNEEKVNPTGVIWNASEEDECEICRATLYLSRVNGLFDRNRAVCVGHALQALEGNPAKHSEGSHEFVTHFTDEELQDILDNTTERLAEMMKVEPSEDGASVKAEL